MFNSTSVVYIVFLLNSARPEAWMSMTQSGNSNQPAQLDIYTGEEGSDVAFLGALIFPILAENY